MHPKTPFKTREGNMPPKESTRENEQIHEETPSISRFEGNDFLKRGPILRP